MSNYPSPSENVPIFNPYYYTGTNNAYLTVSTANSTYARLNGSNITGLYTFASGLSTANIYNSSNTFSVPNSSGQLALVSQIPSVSNFVDLTSNQTINGIKKFNTNPIISAIADGSYSLNIPTLSANDTIMTLGTNQTVSGSITFSSPSCTFASQLGIKYASYIGTILPPILTSNQAYQLPNSSGYFVLDSATQNLSNKTLISPSIQNGTGLSYNLPSISYNDSFVLQYLLQTLSEKILDSTCSLKDSTNTYSITTSSLTANDVMTTANNIQTLSNKTLNSAVLKVGSYTLNYPAMLSDDQIVDTGTTQSLYNKTLGNPVILDGTYTLNLPSLFSNDVIIAGGAFQSLYNKTLYYPVITGPPSTSATSSTLYVNPSAVNNPSSLSYYSTYFNQPPAFTGTAAIIPNAYTLYIAGAPLAGTATITNSYSLYVNSGISYFGGSVGINGNPNTSLTLYQKSATDSFLFTGVSIGGSSSGTGMVMALGYNITSNKQFWIGDYDGVGNGSYPFVRVAVAYGIASIDAISGNNGARQRLTIGAIGDTNSGVILANTSVQGAMGIGSVNGPLALGGSGTIPAGGLGLDSSLILNGSGAQTASFGTLYVAPGTGTATDLSNYYFTYFKQPSLNVGTPYTGLCSTVYIQGNPITIPSSGQTYSLYVESGISNFQAPVILGANSNKITQTQFGSYAYSTTLGSGASFGININFTNTFSSVPIVFVNLQNNGGAYWDQCSSQVNSVTTTYVGVTIRNLTATTASGAFLITYMAIL